MSRKKKFTAKEITRLLNVLQRIPMTEAEKAAAMARRERVRTVRRKRLTKILRMVGV